MRIGINAWPIIENPTAPAAFVIRERVAALRRLADGHQLVALAPADLGKMNTAVFDDQFQAGPESGRGGQLAYEQRHLPRLTQAAQVDLVLTLGRAAPLRSPAPVAVELAPGGEPSASVWARLRTAMGEAGAAGAALRYAWADMKFGDERLQPAERLPAIIDPAFRVTQGDADKQIRQQMELPPAYVLAHGISPRSVRWLLAAWSWVEASVGDQFPLVVVGLAQDRTREARREIDRLDLADSVRILQSVAWHQLPALYRGGEAFLHTGLSASGQEFRWALATGLPIAAAEWPMVGSITGEAAYLAPAGDSRGLGAACLTLLVEPKQVAEPLRQKGLMRAGSYHGEEPLRAWHLALEKAATSRRR